MPGVQKTWFLKEYVGLVFYIYEKKLAWGIEKQADKDFEIKKFLYIKAKVGLRYRKTSR